MKVFVAFVVLATIVNIALANAHHKKHHNVRRYHQRRFEFGYSYVCTLCGDCPQGCSIFTSIVQSPPIPIPIPICNTTTTTQPTTTQPTTTQAVTTQSTTMQPTTTQPSGRKRLFHHRVKHHKRDGGDSTLVDTLIPTEPIITTTTQPFGKKRLFHRRVKHHKRDSGDSTLIDGPTPTGSTSTITEPGNRVCCSCQCPLVEVESEDIIEIVTLDKRKGHSKKALHSPIKK